MNRAAGKAGSGAVVIGSVVLGVGLGTLTLGPCPLGHLSFSRDSDPRAMLIGVFQGSLGLLAIVFAAALLLGQIGRAITYSPRIIGYALASVSVS